METLVTPKAEEVRVVETQVDHLDSQDRMRQEIVRPETVQPETVQREMGDHSGQHRLQHLRLKLRQQ